MSRTFWVAVGAVGGIVAYRRATRAVARARELGPLGTAQVAAQATSSLAGHTANGLGRLRDFKERREGRLVIGSAHEARHGGGAGRAARGTHVDLSDDWAPVGAATGPGGGSGGGAR